jgi:predicted acetyltransferase
VTPLTLRAATRDDARRLAENSLLSYPNPEWGVLRRTERYLTGPYPIESITVAERDGRLVGQARTIPYRGWFGGVESAVGGLAGVAVAPEARRTGVAAALVRHHVAELHLAGAPWSMLYPFAPDFYAAHGWAPASRRLRWRFAPSALPDFEERARVRRLHLDDPDDLAALHATYARHCVATNGSLSRHPRVFQAQADELKDRRFAVGVAGGRGELAGYLLYEILSPTPRPQTLVVGEWVALDAAAERALLGFVAALADQVQAVLLDTPVEHPLGALLDRGVAEREDATMPDEHHPAAQLYSGAMVRIVELTAALAARGYPARSTQVAVEITADTLVPENVSVVTLTLEDGSPRVSPGRAAGAPLIAGPVGPLSAVLTGGLRLADAARYGLLRVDGVVGELDPLLALLVPYPLVTF